MEKDNQKTINEENTPLLYIVIFLLLLLALFTLMSSYRDRQFQKEMRLEAFAVAAQLYNIEDRLWND